MSVGPSKNEFADEESVIGAVEPGAHRITEASFAPVRHGAFTQRERFFQQQETSGAVSFVYLLNDGKTDHNQWYLFLQLVIAILVIDCFNPGRRAAVC